MFIHRNCLKLSIVLSFFMFFGSVQPSQSPSNPPNPTGYWQYLKTFFWNGTYPSSISIEIEEKREHHRLISDVVITTIISMVTFKSLWPVISQMGDEVGVIVEDYLPNVWPVTAIKEKNKEKREQEKIDKIIADYEKQEKIDAFKKRTGITDFRQVMIKKNQ